MSDDDLAVVPTADLQLYRQSDLPAPQPARVRDQPVRPESAFYHDGLGEFLLLYDMVRTMDDPRSAILDFAQSTYETGARLQKWPLDQFELRQEEVVASKAHNPLAPISKMAASKAPNPEGS